MFRRNIVHASSGVKEVRIVCVTVEAVTKYKGEVLSFQ